ncbi:hypothetical protein ABT075_22015 [Streptomyces sp. NPDC002677]|uniref:hypothetical protein n=1 Tax=Streptomyces sp. NPDC002677 TaxID=3154774 RepID=UPI00331CDDAE
MSNAINRQPPTVLTAARSPAASLIRSLGLPATAAEHLTERAAVVVVPRWVKDRRPASACVGGHELAAPRVRLAGTVVGNVTGDEYRVEVVQVLEFVQ